MKISEKIKLDYYGLIENGPVNIVAFGDSLTHGALEEGVINYETVYWNLLRKKILQVRNYIPINVINAGIGGIDAKNSVSRIDKQVLSHNPDLVIVCFGLNDINGSLEDYISSLKTIFSKCKASGSDVIFMSPNMLNTYVASDTPLHLIEYAKKTSQIQNEGRMDTFIYSAVELAKEMDVTVCDCYSEWKKLAKTNDITMLLANRINHPIKEMHELFADMLFKSIFTDESYIKQENDSTIFRG